jgi:hypothetical protein
MNERAIRFFCFSAGIVLCSTALAKLVAAGGKAGSLVATDPILGLSFQNVLWIVGMIEVSIALICFLVSASVLKVVLLAWLATAFVVYRLGLLGIGFTQPCACLGSLTDAIGLSPEAADIIAVGILLYLLLGSYFALLCLWRRQRTPPRKSVSLHDMLSKS